MSSQPVCPRSRDRISPPLLATLVMASGFLIGGAPPPDPSRCVRQRLAALQRTEVIRSPAFAMICHPVHVDSSTCEGETRRQRQAWTLPEGWTADPASVRVTPEVTAGGKGTATILSASPTRVTIEQSCQENACTRMERVRSLATISVRANYTARRAEVDQILAECASVRR